MLEVELHLPAKLFGGNTPGLITHLGLYGRDLGNERWAVRPNQDNAFLKSFDLADESGLAHRYDLLHHSPKSPQLHMDPSLTKEFERQRAHLEQRVRAGDMSALFHLLQLNIATADADNLESVVKDAYGAIGRMPIAETSTPAFPNRSAHLIVALDHLIRRVSLPRILSRFDQDPDTARLVELTQSRGESGGVFNTSTDWYHNVIGVVHYVAPLLGCLSPRFWCVPGTRAMTVVLLSLGLDINGFTNTPTEPMQLLPTAGRKTVVPPAGLHDLSCRHAIHWWVFRLNQMFGYLSDPTTFKDGGGTYAVHEHHHWMLTFGEAFGLMTSLQCAGRDVSAQRSLMNNLFDLISRITGADVDRLCTLTYAKKRAAEVRTKMPETVAALLMPPVERALTALTDLQQHFFIQQQRGDESVQLRLPDGSCEERDPEQAAAMLLKLFRNATHGYGGKSGEPRKGEINAALLVHFDGVMPSDIVHLPFLYLLDILCGADRYRHSVSMRVAS